MRNKKLPTDIESYKKIKRKRVGVITFLWWLITLTMVLADAIFLLTFTQRDMTEHHQVAIVLTPLTIACIIYLAWWQSSGKNKSHLYVVKSHKAPIWAKERTFGVAGDLSSATGIFSEKNIASGTEGERRTAVALRELEDRLGVRIFHGLQWIGSDNADVDHAVLYGNRLALIDSKLWAGIKHHLNSDGTVLSTKADGTPIEREIKFHHAAEAFRKSFPWFDVRSYIAIHSPAGDIELTRASIVPVNGFGTLEEVLWLVEGWFDMEQTTEVNIDHVDDLRRITKSPLAA